MRDCSSTSPSARSRSPGAAPGSAAAAGSWPTRPRAELREALGKAAPIAAALGATVPGADVPAPPAAPPPWPRRPDPAGGLLETIAVRGGEPVDADAHIARLRASARELYGLEPEVALPAAPPDGRLRVLLAPGGTAAVEVHAGPAAAAEVVLEPRALAGGLGPHKWLDRPQEEAWLAVDLDGAVLEAAWANVWIESADGSLLTPPADGRILPGITRARLLAAPHLRARETVHAARSRARPGDLLTSSIRLATPAGVGRSPAQRAVELAAQLREDPAISIERGRTFADPDSGPLLGGSRRLTLERMCGHEGRQEAKKDQRFDDGGATEGQPPGAPGGACACLSGSCPPPSERVRAPARRCCRRSCSPTPTSAGAPWPATPCWRAAAQRPALRHRRPGPARLPAPPRPPSRSDRLAAPRPDRPESGPSPAGWSRCRPGHPVKSAVATHPGGGADATTTPWLSAPPTTPGSTPIWPSPSRSSPSSSS